MSAYKGDERAIEMSRLRDSGHSWAECGRPFGVSKASARKIVLRWREKQGEPEPDVIPDAPAEQITVTDGPEGRTIDSTSSERVKTLDDLLAAAEVDLERWRVDRHVINKWEVAAKNNTGGMTLQDLWQVKAWLSPRIDLIQVREVLDGVLADIAAASLAAPRLPVVHLPSTAESHMLEFGLYDHHVGALCWHEETGADYDLSIAARLAEYAVQELLRRTAAYSFDRILMPIGHDWLHTDQEPDGKGGATSRGTNQDVDDRWPKVFRMAVRIGRQMVTRLREVAPVDIVVAPGNHDKTRAFFVGEVMAALYEADPHVTVTNNPVPRSYVEYGAVMLGMGHAEDIAEKDLPLTMAQEAPEMWGRTSWREFHRGHTHGTKVIRYAPARDVGGVIVRTIPSMVAPDAWHTAKGFRHARAAEAFIWHREAAQVGTIVIGVPNEYRGEVAA